MTKQTPLLIDRPETVTVNGDGLREWDSRPDVHIYRMVMVGTAHYKLSLTWLDGRKLYRFGESPKQIANTEMNCKRTLPPIAQSSKSPQGKGRSVYNPLMQKPSANYVANPIGKTGGNTFKPMRPNQRKVATQQALKLFK